VISFENFICHNGDLDAFEVPPPLPVTLQTPLFPHTLSPIARPTISPTISPTPAAGSCTSVRESAAVPSGPDRAEAGGTWVAAWEGEYSRVIGREKSRRGGGRVQ
jgi:hypothetical protein